MYTHDRIVLFPEPRTRISKLYFPLKRVLDRSLVFKTYLMDQHSFSAAPAFEAQRSFEHRSLLFGSFSTVLKLRKYQLSLIYGMFLFDNTLNSVVTIRCRYVTIVRFKRDNVFSLRLFVKRFLFKNCVSMRNRTNNT